MQRQEFCLKFEDSQVCIVLAKQDYAGREGGGGRKRERERDKKV